MILKALDSLPPFTALRHRIIRLTGGIVRVIDRTFCLTYGDVAELSKGPCQRCVGRALEKLPEDSGVQQ